MRVKKDFLKVKCFDTDCLDLLLFRTGYLLCWPTFYLKIKAYIKSPQTTKDYQLPRGRRSTKEGFARPGFDSRRRLVSGRQK